MPSPLPFVSPTSRARRLRTSVLAGLLALPGLSCGDGGTEPPPPDATVSLTIDATLPAGHAEGPTVEPRGARLTATPAGGGTPSTVTLESGVGSRVTATLPVTLPGGESRAWDVSVAISDAAGDTVFRGAQSITLDADDGVVTLRPSLTYVGADASLATLVLAPRDTTLAAEDSVPLRVEGRSANGAVIAPVRLAFHTRDDSTAAVRESGRVVARALSRSGWIVARAWNGLADSVRVTVRGRVTGVALPMDTTSVRRGDTLRLAALVRDAAGTAVTGATVSWQALGGAVTIADGGIVGVATGDSASVVASVDGRADTMLVRVRPRPVGAVRAGVASLELYPGVERQLEVTVLDDRGAATTEHALTWATADAAVATVNAFGRVRAVAIGATSVTATAGSVSLPVSVTVRPVPVARVAIAPRDTAVAERDTLVLRAVTLDSAGGTLAGRAVTWTALDDIVSIDADGRAVAARVGAGRVTAASEGRADTTTIVVGLAPVAAVVAAPDSMTLFTGDTLRASVVLRDRYGVALTGRTVAWSSSDPAAASVDAAGLVRAERGDASAVVIAAVGTVADTIVVRTVSPPVTLAVAPRDVRLTSLGATATLTAVATSRGVPAAGEVGWASRDTAVASVAASGEITARGNGTTWVVATHASGARDSAAVAVQQAMASVTLTPSSVSLYPGDTVRFTATARDSGGAAIAGTSTTWAVADASLARVDGAGLLEALAVGDTRVEATVGGLVASAPVSIAMRPLATCSEAGTPHAGAITTSTSWSAAASPHQVDDSVVVRGGATLTIEQGALVCLGTKGRLIARTGGRLVVAGTDVQPVRMTPRVTGGQWSGLLLTGRPATPSLVRHARLEGAGLLGNTSVPRAVESDADHAVVMEDVQLERTGTMGIQMLGADSRLERVALSGAGLRIGTYVAGARSRVTALTLRRDGVAGNIDRGLEVVASDAIVDSVIVNGFAEAVVARGSRIALSHVTADGPIQLDGPQPTAGDADAIRLSSYRVDGRNRGGAGLRFDGVVHLSDGSVTRAGTGIWSFSTRLLPGSELPVLADVGIGATMSWGNVSQVLRTAADTNAILVGVRDSVLDIIGNAVATQAQLRVTSLFDWRISGDFAVSGGTLQVDPGARVRFQFGVELPWFIGRTSRTEPRMRFTNGGRLVAQGTASAPVRFEGEGGAMWNGLSFEGGPAAGSIISHAVIRDAGVTYGVYSCPQNSGGICFLSNTSRFFAVDGGVDHRVELRNVDMTGVRRQAIRLLRSGSVVSNVHVDLGQSAVGTPIPSEIGPLVGGGPATGTTPVVVQLGGGNSTVDHLRLVANGATEAIRISAHGVRVTDSDISGTQTAVHLAGYLDGIQVTRSNLTGTGTLFIHDRVTTDPGPAADATYNWWGSADGPGTRVSGKVTYFPWAVSPFTIQAAALGALR